MKKPNIRKLINNPNEKWLEFVDAIAMTDSKNTKRKKTNTLNKNNEIQYKSYARFEEIQLPSAIILDQKISHVYCQRKSTRNFDKKKLSKKQLSTILHYAGGLNYNRTITEKSPRRHYPSAGGLYPLELYTLLSNTSLKRGVYHYYLKNHSLEYLWNISKGQIQSTFLENWIYTSSAIILISSCFDRTTIKYGLRGHMYTLLEAGHVGQSIYLACTALQIGCCAIGGYTDNNINKLLDLKPNHERVLYALAIG